ncbi:hypothetical protein [Poriferisphaera sp. WC338]|uniref:hypothetical protein n=1 Tax=Poriferisphaera sp. WC338 TaxID=3425129 RepID=UPI003D81A1C2
MLAITTMITHAIEPTLAFFHFPGYRSPYTSLFMIPVFILLYILYRSLDKHF